MSASSRLCVALCVAVLALLGCERQIETQADALIQIESHVKRNDYDRAIEIGKTWLSSNPKDGYMHARVGALFLDKAGRDEKNRGAFAAQAVQYAQNAARVDSSDLAVLDRAVSIIVQAGDMVPEDRCTRYKTAMQVADMLFAEAKDHPNLDGPDLERFKKIRYSEINQRIISAACGK